MLTFVTVMLSRFYDDRILTGFGVDSLLMTTSTSPLLLSHEEGIITITHKACCIQNPKTH